MDVTPQILRINKYMVRVIIHSHRLLVLQLSELCDGPSIQRPAVEHLSVIPFKFRYEDAVGLFGAENHFVSINVTVDQILLMKCFEEDFGNVLRLDYIQ